MRALTALACASLLAGCQPAQRPLDDAHASDAPLRWQPCEGCRIECGYGSGRIEVVPVPPPDPLEPSPDCTGCQGVCAVPQRDAGPETLACVHIDGPIYEPSCDGISVLTESARRNVWRDSWR